MRLPSVPRRARRAILRTALLAAALCATLGAALSPAAAKPALELSAGHLRFELNPWYGVFLSAGGVPVIRESHLYIVQPGWTKYFLNQDDVTPTVTTSTEGDARIGTAVYDTRDAYARYRFELRPDDTFRVTLTYGVKGDDPAEIEYDAGYLNANPLQGREFTAETVDGPRSGTVPLFAATENQIKSKLTPDLSRIAFDTVPGRMEISVEGRQASNRAMTLFDARAGRQDWAQRNPMFWFGIGVPAKPVEKGENTVTLTYRFTLAPPRELPKAAPGTPGVAALAAAKRPHVPDLPVIPHPKEMKASGQRLVLSDKTRIIIPDAPSAEEKQAARELQAELKTFWGVRAAIRRARDAGPAGGGQILLGRTGNPVLALAKALKPNVPARAEGYWLAVRPPYAVIAGRDNRGVYNGAQTLKQLLRVNDTDVYLKPATIRDWPSLAMRGVHWFGGPNSWPMHRDMIERILGPYKLNTMLYEAQFTQWTSQPKIWSAQYSTPKDQVRKTVACARAHFIEPIPLVESLAHCEWMFQNDQNLDVVADPLRPYAYDPRNPRSYDILFPVMQETLDLFGPVKYFHIGHDEIKMWARFPPPGAKESTADLYLRDVNTIHDWLKARGIKTMMWGDQLLHYPEDATDAGWAESVEMAKEVREKLPRDILINDWHYQGTDPSFPSVPLLQGLGYDVVGASWYDWGNVQNFARALAKDQSKGLIQTTWTGWRTAPDMIRSGALVQFVAYLLAAEFSWTGGNPGLDDLGYNADDVFRAVWNREPVDRRIRPGFTVDLKPVSNTSMWGWLSAGRTASSAVHPDDSQYGGTIFHVGAPVWLHGALDDMTHPESLVVPLGGRKASELHVLWGTTLSANRGTTVATVRVTYADGTADTVPIAYGSQVFAFKDLRGGTECATAWRGVSPDKRPAAIRRWAWKNPHPEKPLQSVAIVSAGSEAAPVVLGLTGIAPA